VVAPIAARQCVAIHQAFITAHLLEQTGKNTYFTGDMNTNTSNYWPYRLSADGALSRLNTRRGPAGIALFTVGKV
jgi:hypothetical protein